MPPRPPEAASRSSSQRRAASRARRRNGRGEKRSQIFNASSTAMKKLFQRRPRHENGFGIRGKRRLACSRGSGHSSSSDCSRRSHFTVIVPLLVIMDRKPEEIEAAVVALAPPQVLN